MIRGSYSEWVRRGPPDLTKRSSRLDHPPSSKLGGKSARDGRAEGLDKPRALSKIERFPQRRSSSQGGRAPVL